MTHKQSIIGQAHQNKIIGIKHQNIRIIVSKMTEIEKDMNYILEMPQNLRFLTFSKGSSKR